MKRHNYKQLQVRNKTFWPKNVLISQENEHMNVVQFSEHVYFYRLLIGKGLHDAKKSFLLCAIPFKIEFDYSCNTIVPTSYVSR